jgi:CarD family transcriptional regulator
MTTRKKTTRKSLSRPSKAVKRPAKASSTAKSKEAKAARTRTKKSAAKSARSARVVSRASPAREAARAKAKAERAKARRAAAAAAKTPAKRKAPAAKARPVVRAASPATATATAPASAASASARKVVEAPRKKVETARKEPAIETSAAPAATPAATTAREPARPAIPSAGVAAQAAPAKPAAAEEPAVKPARSPSQRQGFKNGEFIVYPAHGVGQIVAVEEQEVAGFRLELFVITFVKDKMTLRVPTGKVAAVGMRKLAEPDLVRRSLDILLGRARIKRTMWSRRAQEYEAKINSGDLTSIAEVVRDLYRSEAQPEQSYSERQLYEAALDRLAREVAVVQKLGEAEALKAIEGQLQKGQRRGPKTEGEAAPASETDVEEAA